MQVTMRYPSPLGEVLLAADEVGLTGLWFEGAKYWGAGLETACRPGRLPVLEQAGDWLDRYFAGERPGELPELHLVGSPFRRAVWELLVRIPYGQTTTYGALADELARRRGVARVSARAVGGAVGHNPVSILVPCHRVMGAGGRLTGYAGGLERKQALLRLEGVVLPEAGCEIRKEAETCL